MTNRWKRIKRVNWYRTGALFSMATAAISTTVAVVFAVYTLIGPKGPH